MSASTNSSMHIKVLVVDDDWTSLSIVSSMLKKWSYEVVTVKSPLDAMATLRMQQNYFNLVVTDLHMPIMNGAELARQINIEFKSIPIILMSADDKESVIVECLASGAVYYIIKPVDPEDLKNVWQYAAAAKKGKSRVEQEMMENVTLEDLDDIDDVEELSRPDSFTSSDDNNNSTNGSNLLPLEDSNSNILASVGERNKRKGGTRDDGDEGKVKKAKVVWTTVLHNLFLQAVRHIGLEKAVPKKILEFMCVPGLTRENVASHLQKYRLFLKRVAMRSAVPTRNLSSERALRSSFAVGHPLLTMSRNPQLYSNNITFNNAHQTLRLSTLGPPLFPSARHHGPSAARSLLPYSSPPAFHRLNAAPNLLRNYGLDIHQVHNYVHNYVHNPEMAMQVNGSVNYGFNGNVPFGQLMSLNGDVGQGNRISLPVVNVNDNQYFNPKTVTNDRFGEVPEKSYTIDELISSTLTNNNSTLSNSRIGGGNVDLDSLFLDQTNNPQEKGGNAEVNHNVNYEDLSFDDLHDLFPVDLENASWQNQNQNQNQNQEGIEMVNSNFGSTNPYPYQYQIGESSIGQNMTTCSQMGRGGSMDADLFAMIQNLTNTSDISHQYLNDQSSDGLVQ